MDDSRADGYRASRNPADGKRVGRCMKNIVLNLWYLLAIGVGLYFAYREGASAEALLFGALGASVIVCVLFLLRWLLQRPPK